jgi:small conductance mechanosensitive channel
MLPGLIVDVPLRVAAASPNPRVAACGPSHQQSWLCSTVFRLSHNTRAAEIADGLAKPARIVLILLIAAVLARVGRRLVRRAFEPLKRDSERAREKRGFGFLATNGGVSARRAQRAETLGAVLGSVVAVLIWVIAVLVVLGDVGINLAPLLAGASVAGVALGFGAQSVVRDVLSGFFMLVEDQFGVGDVIDVGVTRANNLTVSGTVEGVSLRTTRLRDVEGIVWHVPNGEVKRVGNMSQQWSRTVLDVGVAYDADLHTAMTVIKGAADEMWHDPTWSQTILDEPEVWGVEELTASRIVIRLVVKTRPLEQWNVARELRVRIKRAFDHAGIEMPSLDR